MITKDAGPRLLYMAAALALFVRGVNTKGHDFDARAMIEKMSALQTYMEDLEFIEAKEESHGIRGNI
jgi:hypothetical protein